MLRFFLFMASVMATSMGTAGGVSPCPVDTVSIQIMTPGRDDSEIRRSVAELSDSDLHFRAFVTAVTERVAARLAKDKLCIKGAESMESMESTERKNRSLLQFVHWPLAIERNYLVPALPLVPLRPPGSCWISSPWIDLDLVRRPVPSIRSVVRWNQRQLLADQAVLAGVQNVLPGVAMPLARTELMKFAWDYGNYGDSKHYANSPLEPVVKQMEERTPPDILWLFRHSSRTRAPFIDNVGDTMSIATKKGAESYTKLVLALIDRCFGSDGAKPTSFYYNSILDAADLIPLEQYRIDTPIR
ncbi:MAG: hypothetical protein LBI92_04185 [Azoarcus sp.]|jgi:hypothetical protein|nr:hypothetical protein [Azoarcus sp.]